jgi:hypothetical protein
VEKRDSASTGAAKDFYSKEVERMESNKKRILREKPNAAEFHRNAIEYTEFVLSQDQLDENLTSLTKARAIVTVMQLGGSIASALTNLSSIPLHSFSYLASYNPDKAYGGGFSAGAVSNALIRAAMSKAVKHSFAQNAKPFVDWREDELFMAEEYYRKKANEAAKLPAGEQVVDGLSKNEWDFLFRAAKEGVLGAQKHNELLSLRKHAQFGPRVSKAMSHYMSIFTATEEYNRTVTGLAAFELFYNRAKETLGDGTAAFEYAYNQSITAIYRTQGEYNQINRPKLLRSDLGSLVFLYKTFVITTLELLHNMPAKGKAFFLGGLQFAAGTGGIPLLDEFWIMADVLSQKTGVGLGLTKGNAEREFASFINTMGEAIGWKEMDQAVMRGILDTYLGTEVFGRAGVSVGIPMMGALRPGAKLMEEIGKSFGAFGGAIEGAEKSADRLLRGDFEGAAREVPITMVKNFADAYSMAHYGAALNKRGQVTIKDIGAGDIAARAMGFYPAELKWVNDQVRREEYTRAYAKEIKNALTIQYREAHVLGDSERKAEIMDMVREHNDTFKGTALELIDFRKSAEKSAKDAAKPLRERAQSTLSKAQQRDSALKED